MKDKYFVDTNILIYAHNDLDATKMNKAQELIEEYTPTISTQVLNEFSNAFRKKFHVEWSVIRLLLSEIGENTLLHLNSLTTVLKATEIAERYGFSFYDSQIIAAALETDCTILYSEDMQNGLLIDNKVRIVNPFL
jgi:predicted nucleic acid-binding protein